jgi:hypothetical protein
MGSIPITPSGARKDPGFKGETGLFFFTGVGAQRTSRALTPWDDVLFFKG